MFQRAGRAQASYTSIKPFLQIRTRLYNILDTGGDRGYWTHGRWLGSYGWTLRYGALQWAAAPSTTMPSSKLVIVWLGKKRAHEPSHQRRFPRAPAPFTLVQSA